MQHLLFLTHRIPYPPTKGDKVRSYHLLKCLASRYRVHLGAFVDDPEDLAHAVALRDFCETCHLVFLHTAIAKARSFAGLLTRQPLTLPYYYSSRMRAWVNRVLGTAPIRRVLVFSAAMAQYVSEASGLIRVADLVDVDSEKWRQYAESRSWPYSAIYRRESRTLLNYERQIAGQFDAAVFVSAAEASLFRTLAPEVSERVCHINNGVDWEYFSPDRPYPKPVGIGKHAIVFTGAMDYWPNVEAVEWFARGAFQRIQNQVLDAEFWIVGARPTPAVQNLGRLRGVKVTGVVPDIRPYLAHAQFAVAPLRIARGVQNKILEAMAMARPVLASPEAAEGIEARPGKELVVAHNDLDFVQDAMRLLLQRDTADVIGMAARSRVEQSYSWDRSLRQFEGLLAEHAPSIGDPASATASTYSAERRFS
jgi:sugar transferase (PEP-CTERM/EpsH1 system associated)